MEAIRGIAVGRATLAVTPDAPSGFAEYLTAQGLHVHTGPARSRDEAAA
ncbi:hypothetical protein OLG66_11240 [Mycobacterium senegalense]|nr:hypothetical protein [Mycolicibacterium senegalense]